MSAGERAATNHDGHARGTRIAVRLETCLFDLDGTLIDSIELIFRSYEHTYAAHGLPTPTRAELLASLGRPLAAQFGGEHGAVGDGGEHRAVGNVGASEAHTRRVDELIATYRAFNLEHHDALVRAYPGVREGLVALRERGVRLGIVTSKRRDTAQRGLELCGLADLFETVVGLEDSTRHKPDPEPVRIGLERLRAAAEHSAYVGDSPHDLVSGRAAGVRVFGVAWGPFPRATFDDVPMDGWIDEPVRIGTLLR